MSSEISKVLRKPLGLVQIMELPSHRYLTTVFQSDSHEKAARRQPFSFLIAQ